MSDQMKKTLAAILVAIAAALGIVLITDEGEKPDPPPPPPDTQQVKELPAEIPEAKIEEDPSDEDEEQ